MNRFFFILALTTIIQGCSQPSSFGRLEFLGRFPSGLSEVSGLDTDKDGTLWAIEDRGNKDILFQINLKGQPTKKLSIENAKNKDWEDLTISNNGTFYIGDFGNNANSRKDLVIYRIEKNQLEKKTPKAAKIKFSYPEQKKFPPNKDNLLFDAEGFFHWDGYLYIFTKNRSRPYSGKTLVYRVPDKKGEYEAEFLGEFVLCKSKDHCSVTAADISEDGKRIVLIGYRFVYVLSEFNFEDFNSPKIETIDLIFPSQIESVCFFDEKTLLIADEQSRTKGRNLYKFVFNN